MTNPASGISLTPEYSSELKNYELLREHLLHVEEERDHMIHQESPRLQAEYLSKVGKFKLELLELRLEVYRLKRKMELIQSCINTQSEIVPAVIELLLENEIKEQKNKLEQEAKKLDEALRILKLPPMKKEEATELRNTYYKLARKLHPDLNPEQTETMKLLWLKIAECYNQGDLAQMQILEILVSNEQTPNPTPTVLEELKRRNELFSSRIKNLMKEIEHLKINFPFIYKEQLNDSSWIEKENNESLELIAAAMEQKEAYEKRIEILLSGTA